MQAKHITSWAWTFARAFTTANSTALKSSNLKVGFIGLGNMGAPMALNLLNKGCKLLVYDRNREAVEKYEAMGADVASSPKAMSETPGLLALFTMLPSTEHLRDVYEGPQGILRAEGGLRLRLFCDCSTVLPLYTQQLADVVAASQLHPSVPSLDEAQQLLPAPTLPPEGGSSPPPTEYDERQEDKSMEPHVGPGRWAASSEGPPGAVFVDAPVSGGVPGAKSGTLTFMAGGHMDAVTAITPLLRLMGERVVHCGAPGAGQTAKVCNNLTLGITMAAVSEGLALGRSLGLDPHVLSHVFNTSSARCWSSECYNPCPGVMDEVPAASDYKGGFGASLMVKDLRLALEAAAARDQPLPLGEATLRLYQQVVEASLRDGPVDFSAIYKYIYKGLKPT